MCRNVQETQSTMLTEYWIVVHMYLILTIIIMTVCVHITHVYITMYNIR